MLFLRLCQATTSACSHMARQDLERRSPCKVHRSDLSKLWFHIQVQKEEKHREAIVPTSDGLQPTSFGRQPASVGLQPASDGLQPTSDGLQPTSTGLQPASDRFQSRSYDMI